LDASVVAHEVLGEQTADFLLAQHMQQSSPPLLDINFDLEGTNYADTMNSDENMLTINWADWAEFVRDAAAERDPMPVTRYLKADMSNPSRK
jgi:hypothetical protein